jgi:GH25 family lysozyme M1 (1,4-beta-N-acetylmuramidase)
MDVSSHQGNVNWAKAYRDGARFAYVKATESTGYVNPYFAQQYNGSYQHGLIRGAYHFALPNRSSGAAQARYFVHHGGGWSADGKTLPPMLDIEYNPYGPTCYGMGKRKLTRWIGDFSHTVRRLTGRLPTIYTTRDWWSYCVHSSAYGANPLFIARYASGPGRLPAGWSHWTLWQYDFEGRFPGDQDVFHGSYAALKRFALGT